MTTKESDLKNIFECAYLLLLIDQCEDGLWGKSITAEIKRLYSSEKRRRAESITVTLFVVDAIYTFTKNHKNHAIERALNCLPDHRDSCGGYGSFGELISGYPIPTYQIMISCRHTATALLTYLLFQDKVDENIIGCVKFLIAHVNKDGGWGITADPEKEDSDCLTTAHVLELLTTVEEMSIKDILSENYSFKLDLAITNGLKWLKKYNEQNVGFWFYRDEGMKVQYTAIVLTTFRKLKNLDKKLYEKALDKISSLQRGDGGLPLSVEGRSELNSTIWVVNALVNSNMGKYTNRIERSIDFIIRNISKGSYTKNLTAADWAMLLKLSDYKNIHISRESDDKIQNLANTINNQVFKSGNINIVRKKLPTQFHILKEPILGIAETYCPDIVHRNIIEKWLDRTPRWQKWLITAIITLIGIILGILSLI